MRVPVSFRALVFGLCLVVWVTSALAIKLQIRGSTAVEARAAIRDGRLELRGALQDDTGRPIGQARVRVRASRERGGPGLALRPSDRLREHVPARRSRRRRRAAGGHRRRRRVLRRAPGPRPTSCAARFLRRRSLPRAKRLRDRRGFFEARLDAVVFASSQPLPPGARVARDLDRRAGRDGGRHAQ